MVYQHEVEFRRAAATFLTDGVAAGQRVEWLGGGRIDVLRQGLLEAATLDERLDVHDVTVRSLDDRYGIDEVIDPDAQVAAYVAATEEAIAQGYTGLRVVAEATPLVRTTAQREVFARYEILIDRYMRGNPFRAMCAYDERVLGRAAANEIACLHPVASKGATAFRWCSSVDADVGLAGEIDLASRKVFDVTLARTMPILPRPTLVVDAQGLSFIDHQGMLALDRSARHTGTQVLLRTDAPLVHRLASLLELDAVRAGWSY